MDGYRYDRIPGHEPTDYNATLTSEYNSAVSGGLIIFILLISFTSALFEIGRYMIKSCLKERRKRRLVIRILTSVDEERGGECSICLEKYVKNDTMIELSCTHNFHESCLRGWINDHNTCPHCRRNII